MDGWTCAACGGPVPQNEGETTGEAVRRHARTAGHPSASVSRQQPGGTVQRWRTPEEREREPERAEEAAERAREREQWRLAEQADHGGSKGHQAAPGGGEHRRNGSTRRQRWDALPLSTRVCVCLSLWLGALIFSVWLAGLGDPPQPPSAGYCYRYPTTEGC